MTNTPAQYSGPSGGLSITTRSPMATDCYTAYGLHIRSELPLPFPPAAAAVAIDVTIRVGAVPIALPAPVDKLGLWQTAPGAFLLDIEGVARYLVSNGCEILIEPAPQADNRDISVFLAGSVMGALLQQRGITTLHASAIATESGALLFLGNSAAGKSTLMAAMMQRGYAMLADDITAVALDAADQLQVLSAVSGIKLWASALNALSLREHARERVREGIEKYRISPDSFHVMPQPPRAAFVLHSHNQDNFETTALRSKDACKALISCTYHHRFLRGLGQKPAHFRMLTTLARHIPIYRMMRPMSPGMIKKSVDRIEAALRQAGAGSSTTG